MANTDLTKLINLQALKEFKTLEDAKIAADILVESNRAKGVEGELGSLETESKVSLVSAINEVNENADSAQATADAVATLVGTGYGKVGETDVDQTVKGYIDQKFEDATSGSDEKIGTLANLSTDAKDNLVAAINEIDGHADANAQLIGTVPEKVGDVETATVVAYVNAKSAEAQKNAQDHSDSITGALSDLTTEASTLVAAINTLESTVSTNKTEAVVTVEKQEAAETGYAATYVIKQNNVQVGEKINVPKDWMLKNVELKTCTEADQPEAGFKVGDKYFDFSFNTKDASETVTHVYLNTNDLFDSYTSGSEVTDKVVVVVDNDTNKISATVTAGSIAKTDLDAATQAEITAATTAIGKETVGEVAGTGIYKRIEDIETAIGDGGSVQDKIDASIALLDSTKDTGDVEEGKGLKVSIVETDGKIESIALAGDFSKTYDALNSAKNVQGETTATVKDIEDKVDAITIATKAEVESLFADTEDSENA